MGKGRVVYDELSAVLNWSGCNGGHILEKGCGGGVVSRHEGGWKEAGRGGAGVGVGGFCTGCVGSGKDFTGGKPLIFMDVHISENPYLEECRSLRPSSGLPAESWFVGFGGNVDAKGEEFGRGVEGGARREGKAGGEVGGNDTS
ncbi:hypothetical protein Tco_1088347 [Tanacetum coccineum]